MAEIQRLGAWIKANQDKVGTPEFMAIAQAYRQEQGRIGEQIAAQDQQWMAERTDPTQGMSGFQKARAGFGKAFSDMGAGLGQMVGMVPQEEADAKRRRDAALMQTGAGIAGNVLGNIGAAAPFMAFPGANTVVGGALGGAVLGALQPTASGESRSQNMMVGGALGAAVPAGIRAWKSGKAALVDPFTEAGRLRIAGRLLNRSAADPDAVAARLAKARGATPGFVPTVGQAADDAGVASLERAMRAIDPRSFDEVEKTQRGALVDALRGIAGTPEARARAISEADQAVRPLYDAASKATVESDDIIKALLGRPSMAAARREAVKIAAERGEPFMLSQGVPAQSTTPTLGSMLTNPRMAVQQPAQPATFFGKGLHDLKMGLDDAIGTPGLGGIQGAQRNAALGTKADYLSWLESRIPEYGQARILYAQKMRPVNQMDIGQALYERLVPALADQGGLPFRSNAQQYANALRNADDLARSVTGMKGASFAQVMEPGQIATLQGVAKDLSTRAAAETIGRGAGSDTVQKIAMSNIAAEAGIPTWVSKLAAAPAGWAKRLGDVLYGGSDDQIRAVLSDVMKNPQEAASAMRAAGASQGEISQVLRLAGQSATLGIPMSVGAAE